MSRTLPNLLFKAFADPTRLRILHVLRRGEVCVGDIVKILRIPQPKASRHLNYLKRAGLVASRQEGIWRFYSLSPNQGTLHGSLLGCLDNCFTDAPEIRSDANRAKALKKSGSCC